MPKTSAEFSQQMISQLKVVLPELSLDPNTPERKIVDTLAEILSGASIDPYVLNYQYDIDTKVGTDLDKFVATFGFARQGGRRATGTVTFSRNIASVNDVVIATGTTVTKPASTVAGTVTFVTTAPGVLAAGALAVDVPIQCVDDGPLGNVPANTIISITGQATDVSSVINNDGTSGGVDTESDAELRVRFKNTIFRNIAGTKDQYLALAIATKFSNKANVLGPQSRFTEYLQIPVGGVAISVIPYSKYTYNFDYYVTNGDPSNEIFYAPNGINFSFTNSQPPAITSVNIPVGSVVLMEHTYCSINSRNDPSTNLTNFVDIFVNGHDPTSATETISFADPFANFIAGGGGIYDNTKYVRTSTGATPVAGNRLQQLIWQPIYVLPPSMNINGVDFYQGTHYWQVKDTTVLKGSRRSRDGIEWDASVISLITPGTLFTITYTFDKLPLVLNELMDRHKQITTDVLVHAATNRYFNVNLIIMYSPGFNRTSVDAAINTTIADFMNGQQFGTIIQISDLLEIAHDVPGVDNVRLANAIDGVAYGIQEYASDGITVLGAPYTNDFALQDSDLPVLNSVVTTQKSQNTWT